MWNEFEVELCGPVEDPTEEKGEVGDDVKDAATPAIPILPIPNPPTPAGVPINIPVRVPEPAKTNIGGRVTRLGRY